MTNEEYNRKHVTYHVKRLKKLWEREDYEDEWGSIGYGRTFGQDAEWKRYMPLDTLKAINDLCNYKPIDPS